MIHRDTPHYPHVLHIGLHRGVLTLVARRAYFRVIREFPGRGRTLLPGKGAGRPAGTSQGQSSHGSRAREPLHTWLCRDC